MPGRRAIPAKVSRPRLGVVYPRTRLFERLDACAVQPVTWISSPAGAGKTLLSESYLRHQRRTCLWYELDAGDGDPATFFYYLGIAAHAAAPRRRKALPLFTPEYLLAVGTFARRFFEQLCERLRPPAVIVFDDYQDAPADAPLHEIFAEAISVLPEGIRFIVMSRGAPPPALARHRSADAIALLDWDDLRLTADESAGIAVLRAKGAARRGKQDFADLHERAQGWAAGLVLLLEQAQDALPRTLPDASGPGSLVFDYFAHELLRNADSGLRSFLLRTALPPVFSAELAQRLTGQADTARTLGRLLRDNLFTTQVGRDPPRYRYHPLFRDFLLAQVRETLPEAELGELKRRTGELLAADGQAEAAIELLLASQEWPVAARLILEQAEALLGQGRFRTLRDWLRLLPPQFLEADPWLMYWLGSTQLHGETSQARHTLRAAMLAFETAGDATGAYLSWARASEVCFMEWDDFHPLDEWVEAMQRLRKRFPTYPSAVVEWRAVVCMAQALMMRQPFHSDLQAWLAELNAVLVRQPVLLQSLIATYVEFVYFFVRGDVKGMRAIMNALRPLADQENIPPVVRIFWLVNASQEAFYNLEPERSLRIAEEGLALAHQTGVHNRDNCLLDNAVKASVSMGDSERAEHYLKQMGPFVSDTTAFYTSRFYRNSSQLAFFRGDFPSAQEHIASSLAFSDSLGFTFHHIDCQMGQATVLTAAGRLVEAQRALRALTRSARRMTNPYLGYLARLGRADLALQRERRPLARRLLRMAFAAGRQHRFWYLEWWRPEWLSRLCGEALQAGIEPEFVSTLIDKYRLTPPAAADTPDTWPWPLRIHTLGSPRVERDGAPLRFSGKAQQKPLDLLNTLIALGGRDVSVAALCEVLWPDSDGDDAQRAFGVTLHRLRKLVGNEALQLSERRLSLDPQRCWVDSWAFAARLAEADRQLDAGRGPAARTELERALALYRGPFLDGETELAPFLAERRRVLGRLLGAIDRVASTLLEASDSAAAIALIGRGLELHPHAEGLFRSLIRAHLKLGQRSEAASTYRRCVAMLDQLGIPPAPETEALHRAVAH